MKKSHTYFVVILLIIMSFSCNKGRLVGEYYLTNDMKAINPFKGYEILTFENEIGINIVLAAGDRENEINKYNNGINTMDYNYCEYDNIDFVNENYKLVISMSPCLSSEYVHVGFSYLDGMYSFYSNFELLENDNHANYYDSLLINDSWFHKIYYDTMQYSLHKPFPYSTHSFPIKSYYSIESGVVKIDFSDSTYWELENIEW